MWGDNDVLVEAEDLARIKEEVPNIVMNFKASFAQHESFLFLWDSCFLNLHSYL